jgi:diguanylate cyclase (GGDEF)-like protein
MASTAAAPEPAETSDPALALFLARCERLAAACDRDAAALLLRHVERLRAEAAEDLARADAARVQAAIDRVAAGVDDLTGALRRGPGLDALQHEIDRARRSDGLLVVGFVDVDGLKQVNDTRGHQAGDRVLCKVVDALSAALRSYDVIVRMGGDEFVFSLAGAELGAGEGRFGKIRESLVGIDGRDSATVGFAELRRGDTLDTLLERADADLYARRRAARDAVTSPR